MTRQEGREALTSCGGFPLCGRTSPVKLAQWNTCQNRNSRLPPSPPHVDAIPLLLLEDQSEDVLGLVVQAMKTVPLNEEVQLQGCGALRLLLEAGQVGGGLQEQTPASSRCLGI